MDAKYDVITLPKAYSEADRAMRDKLLAAIDGIERRARTAAQPFIDELVEIESRYPTRQIIVPAPPPQEPTHD